MTWQKWGSKQALEKRKTSLYFMEVLTLHYNAESSDFKNF
jgi:hypothetical protein